MCVPGLDPLTLALVAGGLGSSVVGAKMNADSQQAAVDRQNQENQKAMQMNAQARQEEAVRQQDFERAQADEVAKALTQANPEAALINAQALVKSKANPIVQAGEAYNDAPASLISNPTVDAMAAPEVAATNKRKVDMVKALAMLSAITGQGEQANRGINQSGSNISTVGGYRYGSGNVAKQEAAVPAADVTPSDSLVGDLLLLGGQAAGGIGGGRLAAAGVRPGQIASGLMRRKPPLTGKPGIQGGIY